MSEIIDSYEVELNDSLNLANDRVAGSFETKQDWKELRGLLTECEKNIKLI